MNMRTVKMMVMTRIVMMKMMKLGKKNRQRKIHQAQSQLKETTTTAIKSKSYLNRKKTQ